MITCAIFAAEDSDEHGVHRVRPRLAVQDLEFSTKSRIRHEILNSVHRLECALCGLRPAVHDTGFGALSMSMVPTTYKHAYYY